MTNESDGRYRSYYFGSTPLWGQWLAVLAVGAPLVFFFGAALVVGILALIDIIGALA